MTMTRSRPLPLLDDASALRLPLDDPATKAVSAPSRLRAAGCR